MCEKRDQRKGSMGLERLGQESPTEEIAWFQNRLIRRASLKDFENDGGTVLRTAMRQLEVLEWGS